MSKVMRIYVKFCLVLPGPFTKYGQVALTFRKSHRISGVKGKTTTSEVVSEGGEKQPRPPPPQVPLGLKLTPRRFR